MLIPGEDPGKPVAAVSPQDRQSRSNHTRGGLGEEPFPWRKMTEAVAAWVCHGLR